PRASGRTRSAGMALRHGPGEEPRRRINTKPAAPATATATMAATTQIPAEVPPPPSSFLPPVAGASTAAEARAVGLAETEGEAADVAVGGATVAVGGTA